MLEGGKVQGTVVGGEHALVLLDEVGEKVTRPVVLDVRIVLRRIAEERFAPVRVAGFDAALQIELHDVAEVQLDGLAANGTEPIGGHAVVGALVAVLVGLMDDEAAAGGGETGIGQRIDAMVGEIGVFVLLLENGSECFR